MKVDSDGTSRWADVGAGNGAYPLVKIDYAMVPTSGATNILATKIAQFLDYAAGDGQRDGTLTAGYLPLTDDLRAQTLAARDKVLVGAPAPPPTTAPPAAVDTGGAFDEVVPAFDASFASTEFGSTGLDAGALADATGAPLSASSAATSNARSGGLRGVLRALTGSAGRFVLPALFAVGLLAALAGPALRLRARALGRADARA
jgi:hypothetical protein